MTNIYENGTYLSDNPSWHEEHSPWKAGQIVKILEKNRLNPATICEVGCGTGEILKCLSGILRDTQYFGYEISPHAFSICQSKSQPNLKFHLKDLLQEEDACFDVVMAIDVFEHVEDYFGFLRKLRSRARHFIFHIPLDLSVQGVLRVSPILRARRKVGHIHYFTKETALATLEDAGYKIVDNFFTAASLEPPKLSWATRVMHVPRKLLFAFSEDIAARVLGGFSLMVLAE